MGLKMGQARLELATNTLKGYCSTIELLTLKCNQQESNLHKGFRRALSYPLNDGCVIKCSCLDLNQDSSVINRSF